MERVVIVIWRAKRAQKIVLRKLTSSWPLMRLNKGVMDPTSENLKGVGCPDPSDPTSYNRAGGGRGDPDHRSPL